MTLGRRLLIGLARFGIVARYTTTVVISFASLERVVRYGRTQGLFISRSPLGGKPRLLSPSLRLSLLARALLCCLLLGLPLCFLSGLQRSDALPLSFGFSFLGRFKFRIGALL